jgi:hypothetical protein
MLRKKINSECKFNDNFFKIKMGTTDKKNPETIYAELGTYIIPSTNKKTYNEDILFFEKKVRHFLKNKIKASDLCYSDNFIVVVDIANERINCNKKSYLEIQIFFKTKINNTEKNIFKILSNSIYNKYIKDVLTFIKDDLENSGYCYTKNKK